MELSAEPQLIAIVRPFVNRWKEPTMITLRGRKPFAFGGALCLLGVVAGAQTGNGPSVLQPRTSVANFLSAKNVKQVARPNRTRLQGGEHAIGTPESSADSD
jgi:hypothetical protein